jgi:Zn-dependent peptidase ImmA (M78 family)
MIKDLLIGSISQQDLLCKYNANITFLELPNYINGFVFNYKDINNIFVNNKLTKYKRKKVILHELAHIELNQLCQCNKDLFEFYIDKYEDEADKYIKFLESVKK